jgi:hypothetical protein
MGEGADEGTAGRSSGRRCTTRLRSWPTSGPRRCCPRCQEPVGSRRPTGIATCPGRSPWWRPCGPSTARRIDISFTAATYGQHGQVPIAENARTLRCRKCRRRPTGHRAPGLVVLGGRWPAARRRLRITLCCAVGDAAVTRRVEKSSYDPRSTEAPSCVAVDCSRGPDRSLIVTPIGGAMAGRANLRLGPRGTVALHERSRDAGGSSGIALTVAVGWTTR